MFGQKAKGNARASKDDTVLVLDIESGSIAAALVHLPQKGQAKVLSYNREHLPLLATRDSAAIAKSLEKTLEHTLAHISEVAARMRVHTATQTFGKVGRAVVFFAAPWGTPNLTEGRAAYVPGMRDFTKQRIQAVFGDIPVSFYTSADAVAFGSRAVNKHTNTLVTSLRGEMLELLLLNEKGPQAYSTVPLGYSSVLRTLKTHGNLSLHEAQSILSLAHHTGDVSYEPLVAAAFHLGDSFAEGAALLLPQGSTAGIVVVAEHPAGEWFAKNLAANPKVLDLFAEESTVEALLPHHLLNRIEPTSVQDPYILLETLFVENKLI